MAKVAEVPVTVVKPTDPDLVRKVEQGVLAQLGTPPRFHSIKAINVYKNRWRVNVRSVVDEKITILTNITDSFFVHTDANGNVEEKIDKKY